MITVVLVAALSAALPGSPAMRVTPAPSRACPEITSHPVDLNARNRRPFELSVVATGDDLAFQWRKDGVDLQDGGRITGSTTAALTVADAQWDDSGLYDVVVTSGGCSVDSNDAAVGVYCYASCTCLGAGPLLLNDFGCFQTKFALGDPYADCDMSGTLNLADFGCFMTQWALGCH